MLSDKILFTGCFNARAGEGLRITRPGGGLRITRPGGDLRITRPGGGHIMPPAISALREARNIKLGGE